MPFAVAIADIDHFKSVNDAHGHRIGERVLTEIGRTLKGIVRETDSGGRLGGEEFLAILGNNDVEGAKVFAERLRAAVEGIRVQLDIGETLTTTISIGVADWQPGAAGMGEVVERADEALYLAKESGRNRVCVAEPLGADSFA